MDLRLKRIRQELALAAVRYSNSRRADLDQIGGTWVCLFDFPLPAGYNYATTDILIMLPSGYPETPPDWFYLDTELRKENGAVPHFFDRDDPRYHPDKRPSRQGWAGGCIHIADGWRPTNSITAGHSLLTICKLIQDAFVRWR